MVGVCLSFSNEPGGAGSANQAHYGRRRWSRGLVALAFSSLAFGWGASAEIGLVSAVKVKASLPNEPIAYIGHGAFFDHQGRQIVPTPDFVARAQTWYRAHLLAGLDGKTRTEFKAFERRLSAGVGLDIQTNLLVKQRAIDWLIARSAPAKLADGRVLMKLSALKYRLNWKLPLRNDLELLRTKEPFEIPASVATKLRLPEFTPPSPALVTANSGAAYLAECASWNVPIPPAIGVMDPTGTAGWRSLGFIPIPDQFIGFSPAELREFHSADGVCLALPRYADASLATIDLDGVICLSQITSKVCFWDNQMGGTTFPYSSSDQIPIGVPDLLVDPLGRYQAGGAEIEFNTAAGVCTDCHAGENPYIIHPNSNLGTVLFGDLADPPYNLPMFAPNRYDPIVAASWPQNALSHAQPLVPASCVGCHLQGGSGGRFPHLSNEILGYCGTILREAWSTVTPPDTMPPGSPGSENLNPALDAFQAYCDTDPSAEPTNRGDPHLKTTNGIQYDFQAAGEFTSLRNSSTGFELQTRQTPVLTTWTPGPNAHTGLASCPSLNTAAAMLVNGHRVSYQPSSRGGQDMELRVDGRLTFLLPGGLYLGAGNWLYQATTGQGLDVRLDDGTRVVITPDYWSSEGYWYLNVEAFTTPAREGILGPILGSDWLPKAPNGSSFGPAPVGLLARHVRLNQTFADAWRVTNTTSLFDYDFGTSTATFTNRAWPPPPGQPCSIMPGIPPWPSHEERQPVKGMDPQLAESFCRIIEDEAVFDDCVFDLTLTGNAAMADGFVLMMDNRTP